MPSFFFKGRDKNSFSSSPSFKDVDYLSAIPKAIRSTFVHKAAKFHAPIADNYDLKLSIFLLAISILQNSAVKIQKSSTLKKNH